MRCYICFSLFLSFLVVVILACHIDGQYYLRRLPSGTTQNPEILCLKPAFRMYLHQDFSLYPLQIYIFSCADNLSRKSYQISVMGKPQTKTTEDYNLRKSKEHLDVSEVPLQDSQIYSTYLLPFSLFTLSTISFKARSLSKYYLKSSSYVHEKAVALLQ